MAGELTRKIVINGKEYASLDEMPPEIRAVYEKAMSMLADKDANGVPDVFQEKGVWQGMKEVWNVAREAQQSGIRNVTLEGTVTGTSTTHVGREPSAPTPPPMIPAPGPIEPTMVGGGSFAKLVVGIIVALGIVFALKQLGLLR